MVTCRSVRSSSLGKTLMPSGGSVVSVVTSLYTRRMMWGGRFSTLEFWAQRGGGEWPADLGPAGCGPRLSTTPGWQTPSWGAAVGRPRLSALRKRRRFSEGVRGWLHAPQDRPQPVRSPASAANDSGLSRGLPRSPSPPNLGKITPQTPARAWRRQRGVLAPGIRTDGPQSPDSSPHRPTARPGLPSNEPAGRPGSRPTYRGACGHIPGSGPPRKALQPLGRPQRAPETPPPPPGGLPPPLRAWPRSSP